MLGRGGGGGEHFNETPKVELCAGKCGERQGEGEREGYIEREGDSLGARAR